MINFDAIRELREQHNWTQEDIAEKLGLTRNGYAKIERGESTPSLERLDEIAQLFGVSVVALLKLQDKNVILQTQNHQANYYQNYVNSESLQYEIEKLKIIIAHKDEIIQQKNDYIRALKKMANLDNESELIEL